MIHQSILLELMAMSSLTNILRTQYPNGMNPSIIMRAQKYTSHKTVDLYEMAEITERSKADVQPKYMSFLCDAVF